MTKKILYEPAGRILNSEWDLINHHPDGYAFVTNQNGVTNKAVANSFIFDKLRLRVLDRIVPLNLTKSRWNALNKTDYNTDLVYAYNHVVLRPVPWVVNIEWGHVLVGRNLRFFNRNRERIENTLSSPFCKGVFTWTNAAMESLIAMYDTRGFADKLQVIPPARPIQEFDRDYYRSSRHLGLLFVGSIDTPEDFRAKGGREVIKAFNIVRKKYPYLQLTIRARVPDELDIAFEDNIRVIRDVLPKSEFHKLFQEADIFLLPSHYAQEMVVLDAMSWGLPVIASWVATMGEWITDGVDGITLRKPPGIPYIVNGFLTSETIDRHKLIKNITEWRSDCIALELAEAIDKVISSPGLRASLGRYARNTVGNGKLSIRHRNELLKTVFDKALEGAV